MNYKDILNKLPGSWDELKLKDYIKLTPVINDDDTDELYDTDIFTKRYLSELDKNIQIISLITDIPADDIEKISMVDIDYLISKISFMATAPASKKTTNKFKDFNQLSYDNFITFQKLSLDFTPDKIITSAIENLPTMLSVFSTDDHNEDYFLNQSMPEVIASFFIVNLNIKKYLKRLQVSSYKQMMKIEMQQLKNLLMLSWKKVRLYRKTSMTNGTIG